MRQGFAGLLGFAYGAGALATMVYLTFLDGYVYTWWNWIVALPVNAFLSAIWPLYWVGLHWMT